MARDGEGDKYADGEGEVERDEYADGEGEIEREGDG